MFETQRQDPAGELKDYEDISGGGKKGSNERAACRPGLFRTAAGPRRAGSREGA